MLRNVSLWILAVNNQHACPGLHKRGRICEGKGSVETREGSIKTHGDGDGLCACGRGCDGRCDVDCGYGDGGDADGAGDGGDASP